MYLKHSAWQRHIVMPFPKRRDRVFFTPGDMDGPGFFLGAEWALVLYIYLKTLLEKNLSSF